MLDEVPYGWEKSTFSDIFDFKGGNQPPKSTFKYFPEEGYVRLLQIRDFESDDKPAYVPVSSTKARCSEEDVLIARYGASLGRILTGLSGAYNVALVKMIFDRAIIDRTFALFWLQSELFQEPLFRIASRSAQAGFNKQDLAPVRIHLPPLTEQQRIAEILTSVDDTIRATEAVIAQTERVKLGVMEDLLTGGLGSEAIANGEVPDGWTQAKIGDLLDGIDAGVSVNAQNTPAKDGEFGVLKTSCVSDGYFEPNENKVVVEESEQDRLKEPVTAGTIIISRMNTPSLVGANAFVDADFPNLFLPDRLWAMKPKPSYDPVWFGYWFAHQYLFGRLSDLATGTSGSMKNLSKTKIKGLWAAVPSTADQQKIAAIIGSIDNEIAAKKALLSQTKRLKQGLMSDLLTGKKRVV